MISFRRAALLGLNAPLSAIMLAVLGIWPQDDEEPPVVDPDAVQASGGGSSSMRSHRKVARRDIEEDEIDRKRRARVLEEQARRNMAIMLATAVAVAECV